ncbi:MAG: YitT family protein [Bacteroidia bacterium]|nr:YitT family protein [Bacteroidia bacterium]
MKKSKFRSYVFITIGLFIFAFGWCAFLIPAKIIGGGVTGICTLLYFATGFPIGISVLIVNLVLVLIAMRILGAEFGLNTIYGLVVGAFFFLVLQKLITKPIVNEQFMSALLGGIIGGAGLGIAFSHGGNSGGTDIIALIINKYRNISLGRTILVSDVIIITSSFIVFRSIEKIVYGYVVMTVASYTIDLVFEGAKQSYQIIIISKDYHAIADRIGNEIGRGVTFLKAKGWYNKQDTEVLMVIAHKNDKQNILRIIRDTDDKAFISVAKVMGVFGENFDKIKL